MACYPCSRISQHPGPLQQLTLNVLGRFVLLAQSFAPGCEMVDPRYHLVLIPAQACHLKPAPPAVVAYPFQPDFLPRAGRSLPKPHNRRKFIVPFREDICLNHHLFTSDPLDREPPAIHLGRNPFNHNAGGCDGMGTAPLGTERCNWIRSVVRHAKSSRL